MRALYEHVLNHSRYGNNARLVVYRTLRYTADPYYVILGKNNVYTRRKLRCETTAELFVSSRPNNQFDATGGKYQDHRTSSDSNENQLLPFPCYNESTSDDS